MSNLQLIFSSPLIMALLAFTVYLITLVTGKAKNSGKSLLTTSFIYGFAGALLTLIFTIISMTYHTLTTGYGSGNGPLGWIFFYGPIGMSIGQLIALTKWFFYAKNK